MLCPIEMLAFDQEREILCQCFREAARDIDLNFDTATTHRLRTSVTLGCRALHYSGHGHEDYLTFEDGKGGLHCVATDELKNLCGAGSNSDTKVEFVFVSACYSKLAGEAFMSAGVNHVVCCQQDLIQDSAALAFTRAFYLALAVGRTVGDSFEIGRQAVAVSPSVPNSTAEMEKFLLLPSDGNHGVRIFDAKPVNWRTRASGTGGGRDRAINLRKSWAEGKSSGGGSGRSLSLPAPPEDFLGRETDMYLVLNAVLNRRLVSVVGVPGVGRSSLVTALSGYIHQRRNTTGLSTIFFVRSGSGLGSARRAGGFIKKLHKQLVSCNWIDSGRGGSAGAAGSNMDNDEDSLMEDILVTLKRLTSSKRVLIVFDHIDEHDGDLIKFRMFLSQLFTEASYVKVLCTSKKEIALRGGGAGEFVYSLAPLSLKNAVRLFARLCPHLHTGTERRDLVDKLVDKDQGSSNILSKNVSVRTMEILALIGKGYPSRVVDAAYNISAEQFQVLCDIPSKLKSPESPGTGALAELAVSLDEIDDLTFGGRSSDEGGGGYRSSLGFAPIDSDDDDDDDSI